MNRKKMLLIIFYLLIGFFVYVFFGIGDNRAAEHCPGCLVYGGYWEDPYKLQFIVLWPLLIIVIIMALLTEFSII